MTMCKQVEQNGGSEASPGNPTAGTVRITHTVNQGIFDVAGKTVAIVQESLANAFNIPLEAFAFIDGKIVEEKYRFRPHDIVEFHLPHNWKGTGPKDNNTGLLKSPFPYLGGKSKAAPEVWRRFGDVKNYVEPFLGSGAVLLNRPTWGGNRIETVNDLDSLLVNFWRALKLHPRKLANAADFPISELDQHARHAWLVRKKQELVEQIRSQEAWCDPKVAAWWVWGISQWRSGGWCASGKQSRRIPNTDSRGIHRISFRQGGQRRSEYLREYFHQVACRLEHVRIVSGDWRRVLVSSFTTRHGLTGILLDPPYTDESGREARIYAEDSLNIGHEVRDWAVEHGSDPKLRIALCGYEGEYRMPSNWSVFEWKSAGTTNGHKERIWFSPHCLP